MIRSSRDNGDRLEAALESGSEPTFSFGPRSEPVECDDVYEELPFKRSVFGTLIVGGMLALFCIPYFEIGDIVRGPGTDTLFGLVTMLFGAFWLTGWTVGVAFLAVVFLGSMFGRETVHVRPGHLILRKELFGLGIATGYPWQAVENLRKDAGDDKRRGEWRGPHLAFDYGDETVRFGSHLDDARAERLLRDMQNVGAARAAEPPRRPTTDNLPPAREHVSAESAPSSLRTTPIRALVIANLVPLLGVLFDDWNIGDLMLLFWAESAVIGFFNLLKIWVVGRWIVLIAGPFFIGHFGGFMSGHLLFIYGIFISESGQPDASVLEVFRDFIDLWPAFLALFVSHAISYKEQFLGNREYEERQIQNLMSEPYARIFVMHITLLLGGAAAMALDDPLPALLLLIGLKILVDIKAHRRQHDPGVAVRAIRRKRVLAAAAGRKATRPTKT